MPAKFRLSDIKVEEVSLVDRPANQRKFLIVKAVGAEKGQDMPIPLEPDGKGGFVTTTEQPSAESTEAAPPDVGKQKMELPMGAQEPLMEALTKVIEKAEMMAKEVKGAKEVEPKEGEPPIAFPEAIATGLQECAAYLTGAIPAAAPAPAPEDEPPAEGAPSEMDMSQSPADIMMSVEKLGAKMSKERYARFKQALSVLGTLLSELAPPEAAPQQATAPAPAPSAAPAPAPSAAPAPQIGKLQDELQKLRKQFDDQSAELSALKKARTSGNAIPANSVPERVEKTEDESTYWPLDLNAEVSKADLERQGISFID